MAFDNGTIRYFIRDHGVLVTLRKRAKGSYDASTGSVEYTNTDYKVYGYSYKNSPTDLTDNSTIISTRKLILSNLQKNGKELPSPKVNDQIVINNEVFNIMKVSVVKSANKVVCYTLDLKG